MIKVTRSQLRKLIKSTITEANDSFSRRSFLTGTGIRKNSDPSLLRDIVEDDNTPVEQLELLIYDPNMDTQTRSLAIKKIRNSNQKKHRSVKPTQSIANKRKKVKDFNDLVSHIADEESKGLDTSEKKKMLVSIASDITGARKPDIDAISRNMGYDGFENVPIMKFIDNLQRGQEGLVYLGYPLVDKLGRRKAISAGMLFLMTMIPFHKASFGFNPNKGFSAEIKPRKPVRGPPDFKRNIKVSVYGNDDFDARVPNSLVQKIKSTKSGTDEEKAAIKTLRDWIDKNDDVLSGEPFIVKRELL